LIFCCEFGNRYTYLSTRTEFFGFSRNWTLLSGTGLCFLETKHREIRDQEQRKKKNSGSIEKKKIRRKRRKVLGPLGLHPSVCSCVGRREGGREGGGGRAGGCGVGRGEKGQALAAIEEHRVFIKLTKLTKLTINLPPLGSLVRNCPREGAVLPSCLR
jgi:hypothetical protein